MTPEYSDAVKALIAMTDEVVPAAAIAPILKMHPSAIVYKAKEGIWDREICNYVISGRCVKFFRIDFLRKGRVDPVRKINRQPGQRLTEKREC